MDVVRVNDGVSGLFKKPVDAKGGYYLHHGGGGGTYLTSNLNEPGERYSGPYACIYYLDNDKKHKNKDDSGDDFVIHMRGLGNHRFREHWGVSRGNWDCQSTEGGKSTDTNLHSHEWGLAFALITEGRTDRREMCKRPLL